MMRIRKTRRMAARMITAVFCFSAVHLVHAEDMPPASSGKPVVEQIVDLQTKLAKGPHAGFRSNHAKGIMAGGTFTPAATAAGLSKAPHLQTASSPVIVRFSNATGVPNIPDASPNANPRGMAIRFQLADGGHTDIVAISVNGFPVATPEEFLGLLSAVAASGSGATQPAPIETFLETHPAALRFVATPKPAPVSFATQTFFGVNAFAFSNAKGETRFGRYRIAPVAGAQALTEEQAANAAPNYLMDELPARLKQGEVKFRLLVQLAEEGDVIDDPTVVWPDSRSQVELGVLTLEAALPDSRQVEKTIMFSPLNLPDGIAGSADPILAARPAAYAVSFGRRFAD